MSFIFAEAILKYTAERWVAKIKKTVILQIQPALAETLTHLLKPRQHKPASRLTHSSVTLCLYVWRSSIWFFLFSLICSLSLWTVCLLLTVRFFLQFLLCLTMHKCVLLWFREQEHFCEGACHTDHTHTHSWENRHLSAVCHQRSYVMEYVSVRVEGTDPGFLT